MTSAMIPRDRPAPADGEVEITLQMIEAGADQLATDLPEAAPSTYLRFVAERTFREMLRVSRQECVASRDP
jgi:hypothetical protein